MNVGDRVSRKLTTELYPTASLHGVILNVKKDEATVQWADGGVSTIKQSKLSYYVR